MFKKLSILFLILLVSKLAYAQTYNYDKKNSCDIYFTIIKNIDTQKPLLFHFCVVQKTSSALIKKYHFKNPFYNLLDTDTVRLNKKYHLDHDWRMFLNAIDTAKIKNYPVTCNFNIDYKALRYSDKHDFVLIFSPVVFSPNGDKAICAYEYYVNSEDSSGIVLFLEKRNGQWVIVNRFQMYIS